MQSSSDTRSKSFVRDLDAGCPTRWRAFCGGTASTPRISSVGIEVSATSRSQSAKGAISQSAANELAAYCDMAPFADCDLEVAETSIPTEEILGVLAVPPQKARHRVGQPASRSRTKDLLLVSDDDCIQGRRDRYASTDSIDDIEARQLRLEGDDPATEQRPFVCERAVADAGFATDRGRQSR